MKAASLTRSNHKRRLLVYGWALAVGAWFLPTANAVIRRAQSVVAQERQGIIADSQNRPELILQAGHNAKAEAIAFSPDGRLIATGGADTAIKIWDAATGRVLRTLRGHAGGVKSVAFSPDGQQLASGGNDGRIRFWELVDGTEIESRIGSANAIAFSSDGRWLAAGGAEDFKIRVWDLKTGEERRLEGHTLLVLALAFSPDGNVLASGSADATINLWEVTKKESKKKDDVRIEPVPLTGHTGWIRSLAFSPDGRMLVSGDSDGAMRLWKIPKGKFDRTIRRKGAPLLAVAFLAGGAEVLGTAADRSIERYDVATGTLRQSMPGREKAARYEIAAFSPDGQWLAANGGGRTSELRQVADGGEVRTLESRVNGVKAIALGPNGRWFATGNQDGTMTLWDALAGRVIAKLGGGAGSIDSLAFHPDAPWLAWGSRGGKIRVWDLDAAREVGSWQAHENGVSSLVFSANGDQLISGSADASIRIWETKSWRETRRLSGHPQGVTALCVSGQQLISAGVDRRIRVWNLATGQLTRTLTGHEGIVYGVAASAKDAAKSFWIASAGEDRSVRLWKGETGELVRVLRGPASVIYSLAISPDGTEVMAGEAGGEIRAWDMATGAERFHLASHPGGVNSLCFQAGQEPQWLFSGGEDGSVRVWEAKTGVLAATLLSFRGSHDQANFDWLAVTPDGLFDGSPAAWKQILWRFKSDPLNPLPVEIFYNDFFQPDVLADLFAGKHPHAGADISLRDRRQPRITLAVSGDAPGGVMTERNLKVRLEVAEHSAGSGARDVRLFRNGSLVMVWRGNVLGEKESAVTLSYELPIVAGENRLTAYAFNRDNVKSADESLTVAGAQTLVRPGTLYILGVGINRYANQNFDLKLAVADAERFSAELQLRQQQIGRFAKVESVLLLNEQATRANLLAALGRLSGRVSGALPAGAPPQLAQLNAAQPEDAVVVFFAGHGVAWESHFYLIPHDLRYQGSRDDLDKEGMRQVTDNGISELEIEKGLESVDAGNLLLIIDACQSGQALGADGKAGGRGPTNSKGLAQLAYDKGINILTAAQRDQVAIGSFRLGHGLLTYALVEEGIRQMKADNRPPDHHVLLREWLDYATDRVPGLHEEDINQTPPEKRDIKLVLDLRRQRPRVFYRREIEAQPLLIAK